jgi:hypothetical protein
MNEGGNMERKPTSPEGVPKPGERRRLLAGTVIYFLNSERVPYTLPSDAEVKVSIVGADRIAFMLEESQGVSRPRQEDTHAFYLDATNAKEFKSLEEGEPS